MMRLPSLVAAVLAVCAANGAAAADYHVMVKRSLVYAVHDGAKLVGDFYLPKDRAMAPTLVALHGGAWRAGSRASYQYWGRFLARKGYGLFAIEYRLGNWGRYPAAVYDAKAAIQFVRANAAKFDIDADRVGLMGDSAGAQLAALLALAGDRFNAAYRNEPNAGTPINVKAVVGFYGIYDMLAQWKHDRIASPGDSIVEDFLGVSPPHDQRVYVESSPVSYSHSCRREVRFLLMHGANDRLVDPKSQTGAFLAALTAGGFSAKEIINPRAGHFWASEPFERARHSYAAMAAPQVLQFLKSSL